MFLFWKWGCFVLGKGVERNFSKGLSIIKESCVANVATGWNTLGDCYRYGYGVDRSNDQAIWNYNKAISANLGVRALVDGHMSLGDMYEKGEGLPKVPKQAAYHFMFAADRYKTRRAVENRGHVRSRRRGRVPPRPRRGVLQVIDTRW